MRVGSWLQPRYANEAAFTKDFPQIEMKSLDVYCPGCKDYLRLNRRHPAGRIAGWCKTCARGVSP